MRMAVQSNVRVSAAARTSFQKALKIAYRSGTITGMLTDGLGLLGGTVIFMIFGISSPDVLLGFGFGGTLLALFMRVGGGIYTKAADVGADLVGKVEAGIPEDDPRNAAVIADLVGDNVGDCAGMAADIFESYEVTIVSGLILGLALVNLSPTHDLKWIIFPLLVRGIGVLSSIIGTYIVGGSKNKGEKVNAMSSINKGFYTSAAICLVAFFFIANFYMHEFRAFLSVGVGIILAIVIDELTKYFTDTHYKPVKDIAAASKTGSATLILRGLATGFEASVWQVIVIAATILVAVLIYWGQPVIYVLYGVAMTGESSPSAPQQKKRLTWNEQRELEAMENTIHRAEAVVNAIQTMVGDPSVLADHKRARDAFAKLAAAQEEVERLYSRWTELDAKKL
jgi:K(+)-stimulated pyrophosphate-energized sodium pump